MANLVSLGDMESLARLYAEERPGSTTSTFTAQDVYDLININGRKFYDLLVKSRSGYHEASTTIAVVNGTAAYALPADFYEALDIRLAWGPNDNEPVERFEIGDTYKLKNLRTWGKWTYKGCRIAGVGSGTTNIIFAPTPSSSVTCEIDYVPVYQDLTAPADTIDDINGWSELVCVSAALQMVITDGRNTADLRERQKEERTRILDMVTDRDASRPKYVRNVFPDSDTSYYYRYLLPTP